MTLIEIPKIAILALGRLYTFRNIIIRLDHVGDNALDPMRRDADSPSFVSDHVVYTAFSSMALSLESVPGE